MILNKYNLNITSNEIVSYSIKLEQVLEHSQRKLDHSESNREILLHQVIILTVGYIWVS